MRTAACLVSESTTRAVRVGYCIDCFEIGGTELNAVRTLEALDRQRFAVTVFHLRPDGPLRTRYQALGARLIGVPIGPLYSRRTALQAVRFLRLLRSEGIEVVHTHDLYTNVFAAPLARLAGCRVIASRRWLYATPRAGMLALNRWSYRFANRVLTNSAHAARVLVKSERVPAARVVELPNFLEERAFRRLSPEVRTARRATWGVPADAFLVGSVARLAPVKNHPMLLRALVHLAPDVHLVLVGDGPCRSALEQLAQVLGVQGRVHFLGQLVETINLHQFFDVSVLCSHSEGSPNSLIEALAAGCPVIATPVGGVPEVIADQRTGLLVPRDDSLSLAARLSQLRADGALRARLSEAGITCARSKYHENVVIRQLESLYQDLAREAGSRDVWLT